MFDNSIISKTICVSVMGSVMLSCLPARVEAQMLVPESFSRMYSLAQQGNVEALRGSVHRGMNIDVMDENGDTGLCIAAKRRDAYTYNAFRAAGANPRHPCTQNVSGYESFVNSSGVVSVNSTARAAYGKMGKESYVVSPWVWWGLGALAVGGVVAAVASGGGGGGKGGDSSSGGGSVSPTEETISSSGANLASSGRVTDSTTGNKINYTKYTVNNTNAQLDGMELNKNMPENAKYLNVILQAKNGGTYTNAENTALTVQNGTVGMAAVNKGVADNKGFIDVASKNASIGMLASESSEALNEGKGVISQGDETNGISMAFTGTKETDAVVGMYADTNSTVTNDGEIKGTATTADGSTTSASTGSIIGMETMIINSGPTSVDYKNTAINNGKIELSAGVSGSSDSINVNIIGMGSYLDNGFLTDNKNINRAESSVLTNNGTIDLSYAGNYTTTNTKTLRAGTGGVVGMRSDANNKAQNNGKITISLPNETTSASSSEEYAISAGMQSVHGGDIINNKKSYITINTNAYTTRGNYGMVSVEGSGTVSGLYTRDDHTITNNGTINMNTSNSFAMASYNGGYVKNAGSINLGNETTSIYNKNVGLYGDNEGAFVNLVNTGEINVYSNASAAIENDYGGGTLVENDGTINIMRSATNSYVFAGNYSSAVNNGEINYYATSAESSSSSSSTSSSSSSSSETKEFPVTYTLNVQHSAMSTKAVPLISTTTKTTSKTETADNNGDINLFGSTEVAAMAVETKLGVATNYGNIKIGEEPESPSISKNSIGMYVYEDAINGAKAVNNGVITVGALDDDGNAKIYTQYSAAMASKSKYTSSLNNQNAIWINSDYSFGMYAAGSSNLINNGTINLYGNHDVAFYSAGEGVGENAPQIYNTTINVNAPNAIAFAIIGNAELRKFGAVNICTSMDCEAKHVRDTFNMFYVAGTLNLKDITIPAIDGGTLINVVDGGVVNNYITLSTTANGGYIFSGSGSSQAFNQAGGVLNLNGAGSYGMYSKAGHEATNYGVINVSGANSYGMYADYEGVITNGGRIIVDSANSYGMYATGGAETMINNGTIVVNNDTSWGMYAVSEDGDFVNNGTIAGTNRLNENVEDKEKTDTDTDTESDSETSENTENQNSGSGSASPSAVLRSRRALIHAAGNSHILNNGTISDTVINFDDYTNGTGQISIGKGGKYEANSLSGTIYADANIAAEGFETTYINPDSFVGSDEGINLLSGSYLFDAVKVANNNGNIDVVMTMKPFESIVENSSLGGYLQENYAAQKREDIFAMLKKSADKGAFDAKINRIFGLDFVPNLSAQSLENERIVSREINGDLLDVAKENVSKAKVKAFTFKNSANEKGNVVGFKDKVAGVYGFYEHKTDSGLIGGFGLTAGRAESEYDNSSSRYNNVIEFFAPIIKNVDDTTIMAKPKVGYAAGHYRREGENSVYKADTKEYYYGVDFAVTHSYDAKVAVLEPNVGFDVTGIYFDNVKENNNGLRLGNENMLSMQSVIGLDIKKQFEFSPKNILAISTGGKYLHEFGNKYRTSAHLADTVGSYKIVGNRLNRDFGLLNIRADYKVQNFDFNASVNKPLDSKQDTYYTLGLGYKF